MLLPVKNILELVPEQVCKMAVSIRGLVRSWESRNFGKESVILFQARGKTIHYLLSIKLANWKIRKYILF